MLGNPTVRSRRATFCDTRKRVAQKLQNPRILQIMHACQLESMARSQNLVFNSKKKKAAKKWLAEILNSETRRRAGGFDLTAPTCGWKN